MRRILLLAVFLVPLAGAHAQYYAEDPYPVRGFSIGIKGALSDLWGDIGTRTLGSHYFNGQYFGSTHYMGGIMGRYSITRWLSARAEASAGTIFATDVWNRKAAASAGPGSPEHNVYYRNQDAKTTILEGALHAEIMPLRLLPRARYAGRMPLQPVIVAGIGVFNFNPKTSYTDASGHATWVATEPLHLEGEGLPYAGAPEGYKRTQICIPVGAGLRYEASPRLAIGFEYLLRITATDYLDGVSDKYVNPNIFSQYLSESDAAIARQVYNKSSALDPNITHPPGDIRGNPGNKDLYSTLGFHITWRMLSQRDRL